MQQAERQAGYSWMNGTSGAGGAPGWGVAETCPQSGPGRGWGPPMIQCDPPKLLAAARDGATVSPNVMGLLCHG